MRKKLLWFLRFWRKPKKFMPTKNLTVTNRKSCFCKYFLLLKNNVLISVYSLYEWPLITIKHKKYIFIESYINHTEWRFTHNQFAIFAEFSFDSLLICCLEKLLQFNSSLSTMKRHLGLHGSFLTMYKLCTNHNYIFQIKHFISVFL